MHHVHRKDLDMVHHLHRHADVIRRYSPVIEFRYQFLDIGQEQIDITPRDIISCVRQWLRVYRHGHHHPEAMQDPDVQTNTKIFFGKTVIQFTPK